ncbi:hypothetical protein FRC09_001822 [Ceratobasidium sp. 395]|nr:hypothetical protein FRC09_001822 [Ceratobasidium sp. 395]
MSHRSTAPHKIFGVPELLGIICKYSECLRSPHLLQISRAFFLAGVPLVWQEVVGVQNLLKLLPGVSFNATGEARIQGTVFNPKVVSSDLENITRFARFDLYAQFVKYLKLFSPDISSYIVTGWRHLSELTKRRVLLPNLLELGVTASYPLGFIKNSFLWIRMFLSPSLTSIVVEVGADGKLSTVPSLAAKSLLGHIETTCHNLQHLQLFPGETEASDTSKGHSDLVFADFWERSFFERLAGFQLQKLGCTTELVSPEWIHLLGEFSLLKTLDLYTVHSCRIADSQPKRHPRLEHFGIHFAPCNHVEKIARLGILRGLNSLKIVFREPGYQGPGTAIEEGWEIGIILSISRNCSELTKLHLEFDDNTDFMPNLPSFRPLGALPLAEVCLKGEICVRNNELDDLATIWPNVTRFEMWDLEEDLRLQGLRNFAKLPRVQHLALPVSWHHGIPLSITPAEPSYTLRTFEILNSGLRADFDVSLLAQYAASRSYS